MNINAINLTMLNQTNLKRRNDQTEPTITAETPITNSQNVMKAMEIQSNNNIAFQGVMTKTSSKTVRKFAPMLVAGLLGLMATSCGKTTQKSEPDTSEFHTVEVSAHPKYENIKMEEGVVYEGKKGRYCLFKDGVLKYQVTGTDLWVNADHIDVSGDCYDIFMNIANNDGNPKTLSKDDIYKTKELQESDNLLADLSEGLASNMKLKKAKYNESEQKVTIKAKNKNNSEKYQMAFGITDPDALAKATKYVYLGGLYSLEKGISYKNKSNLYYAAQDGTLKIYNPKENTWKTATASPKFLKGQHILLGDIASRTTQRGEGQKFGESQEFYHGHHVVISLKDIKDTRRNLGPYYQEKYSKKNDLYGYIDQCYYHSDAWVTFNDTNRDKVISYNIEFQEIEPTEIASRLKSQLESSSDKENPLAMLEAIPTRKFIPTLIEYSKLSAAGGLFENLNKKSGIGLPELRKYIKFVLKSVPEDKQDETFKDVSRRMQQETVIFKSSLMKDIDKIISNLDEN